MFVVDGQQTDAGFREQSEINAVVGQLAGHGYAPVVRSMVDAACAVARIQLGAVSLETMMRGRGTYRSPDETANLLGDLLFKGLRAYVLQPIKGRLHAWEIRPHSVGSELPEFCAAVETAARATLDGRRLRGMEFTWKQVKERPARRFAARGRFYQEAKLETKSPDYSPQEAEAAKLLVSAQIRSFLLRLAQVGKARSTDAAAEGTFATRLLDAALVRREYLVLCRQDSHTICAIQDRAEIDTGGASRFVCTICGRPFKDELVQEIFALTDFGKRLLSASRWMTIWVTELLITSGISRDHIAWNAVAAEDELDIMTDALGPRAFFELKDRDFGLGDAYPFAYRVTRYGGSFGIVVSTERVAEEAKKFFAEQRPSMGARIETLEGQGGIETGIPSLVDRVSRTGVMQLLAELEESFGLNTIPVVQAWMERVADECVSVTSNLRLHPAAVEASVIGRG